MRLDLAAADDLARCVRGAEGESVVLVIGPREPLAMAMTRAAIAPLAIERAPTMRVNAVVPGHGADPRDVGAAVAFLDSARSTTGQILDVG